MQTFIRVISVMGILAVACYAPLARGEVKIAVVDVQRAVLQTEEARGYLAQIQEEFKDEETELREIQTQAASLLERLQKDSEVMSDSEKRKLQGQIESKNNDFVYLLQKLQKQAEERQQELFAGMDQKLQKAIEDLVLAEDYDLIMPRSAALYVGDLYDITRKVTERLNKMASDG